METPADDLERREREIAETHDARQNETAPRRALRHLVEKFKSAKDILGEHDFFLFKSAGFSKDEMGWAAEVKKSSAEHAKYTGKLSAYDLVLFHAMLEQDRKKYGSEMISKVTERYLEKLLAQLQDGFTHPAASMSLFTDPLFAKLQKENNPNERVEILTKLLNIFHHGGNPEGLGLLGGYPNPYTKENHDGHGTREAAKEFLTRLNDLGMHSSDE